MPKIHLRTQQDVVNALRTLGMSVEEARDTKPKHTSNPDLAKAVRDALDDKKMRKSVGEALSSSTSRSEHGASAVGARAVDKSEGPQLAGNVPEVAALLQRYGLKEAPRPLERVLVHVAKIDAMLASEKDPDKLVELVMAKDLRRQVFLVEGWAKLYGRIIPEAEAVEASFKQLEDVLGQYSATKSNLAFAVEKQAPLSAIRVLEKERDGKRAELKALLTKSWMHDAKGRAPAVKTAMTSLANAELDDYAADKEAVKKELARRLTRVAETPFDMAQLETGIHELRRQLRWFPIFSESLNGLVQLDPTKNPVKAYEHFLTTPLATSKYVDLPDASREDGAFQVPKTLYCALMQLTLDLGGIKDTGEPMERLMHAYHEAGIAKDLIDAHRLVAKLIGGEQNIEQVHTDAAKHYADMQKNRLVEKLAAVFTRRSP